MPRPHCTPRTSPPPDRDLFAAPASPMMNSWIRRPPHPIRRASAPCAAALTSAAAHCQAARTGFASAPWRSLNGCSSQRCRLAVKSTGQHSRKRPSRPRSPNPLHASIAASITTGRAGSGSGIHLGTTHRHQFGTDSREKTAPRGIQGTRAGFNWPIWSEGSRCRSPGGWLDDQIGGQGSGHPRADSQALAG